VTSLLTICQNYWRQDYPLYCGLLYSLPELGSKRSKQLGRETQSDIMNAKPHAIPFEEKTRKKVKADSITAWTTHCFPQVTDIFEPRTSPV
jgi:hypothetical protein